MITLIVLLAVLAYCPPVGAILLGIWLAEDAYRKRRWERKRKEYLKYRLASHGSAEQGNRRTQR